MTSADDISKEGDTARGRGERLGLHSARVGWQEPNKQRGHSALRWLCVIYRLNHAYPTLSESLISPTYHLITEVEVAAMQGAQVPLDRRAKPPKIETLCTLGGREGRPGANNNEYWAQPRRRRRCDKRRRGGASARLKCLTYTRARFPVRVGAVAILRSPPPPFFMPRCACGAATAAEFGIGDWPRRRRRRGSASRQQGELTPLLCAKMRQGIPPQDREQVRATNTCKPQPRA